MNKYFDACRRRGLRFGEQHQFSIKHGMIFLLVAAMSMLAGINAQAVPFTTDLTISGQVEFDTGFALADGTVSQTGSFSTIEGGAASSSTFAGETVTAGDDNPLLGTLTDLGDGFGIVADVDAGFDSEFAIGLDIDIGVTNTSATDTYKVTFKVDFSNAVDSSGTDAYADSEFTVDDPGGEVFFTDLISDSKFGDEIAGVDTGTFGDSLSESGLFFFDVIFAPLATGAIVGEYTLDGGAFVAGSTALADFSGFISVDAVMNLTSPPAPIPEPATLFLIGTGLTGLAAFGRRRKARG